MSKKVSVKKIGSPCFVEWVTLLVRVNSYLLCARSYTWWDLGCSLRKDEARAVLIAILLLWFPSREEVGCHDVTVSLE